LVSSIPSLDDVQRIIAVEDPVIRNLQITQCYHELSLVLAKRTGFSANWCTFATWASKQAGQSIRKEDLARLLEMRLRGSRGAMRAAENYASSASPAGAVQTRGPRGHAIDSRNFTSAIDRASDAVGRGNKKVFEEIGYQFARFYQSCLAGEKPENVDPFCEALRPGDPPEGQRFLRQAFSNYAQSLQEVDAKIRAELILLANVEIGLHEQTRLQPEIAESLDAGLTASTDLIRSFLAGIFPFGGWVALLNFYFRKAIGRPTQLDLAILDLTAEVRAMLRQILTEVMMIISLPSGVTLSLGDDLVAGFPGTLQQITNSGLKSLLELFDPTPDSLVDSGAVDWADLPDRLHFIIDLFRCYQERLDLSLPPFMPEQVEALKAGKLPAGRL
jgi:hypothetical protein